MLRKAFVLTLFFLASSLLKAHCHAIIGIDEMLADTSIHLVEKRFEKALTFHPSLQQTKTAAIEIAKPRTGTNKTGLFFIAVILLFLFSLARLVFPRYFNNLFQVFATLSFSKRNIKEQLETDNRASLWFYIIFYLSAGFILYQFLLLKTSVTLSEKPSLDFIICTALVFFIVSIRFGIIRLIGWVFNGTEFAKQYLFSKKLIHELLGLLLFPICLLIMMGGPAFKWKLILLAVALYILMFIYGYLRNLALLRNLLRISFIHFLLYLCALEVIPVLILIKIIS